MTATINTQEFFPLYAYPQNPREAAQNGIYFIRRIFGEEGIERIKHSELDISQPTKCALARASQDRYGITRKKLGLSVSQAHRCGFLGRHQSRSVFARISRWVFGIPQSFAYHDLTEAYKAELGMT